VANAALIDASAAFMAAAQRQQTLYDLSADYVEILDLMESGETDEALELRLNQLAGRIAQKAEAIAGLVTHLNGIAGMRRAEADRLRTRAQSDEAAADRLKAYLLRHMREIGQDRIETTRYTLAIRQNPPSVAVLEEMLIPKDFIKTVVTESIDKRKILEHVKQTGEVPDGVDIVRTTRLDIR